MTFFFFKYLGYKNEEKSDEENATLLRKCSVDFSERFQDTFIA